MEGIQILNQFEVVTKTQFSWDSFWTGAAVGFLVALFATIIAVLTNHGDWPVFLIAVGIFGMLSAVFLGLIFGGLIGATPVAWETRYEVTISSEVSMAEFMDKYEILETRGSIYTIREKVQQGD